ncbi:MAG TPA: phosphotransferase [Kofleriaceae bacterium]|nr:phosphotransferase [Kofleriaceae bacterium]
MAGLDSALAAVAHLLPEPQVGRVTAIQPISMGLSGAAVYAVSSTRGELVLRVNAAGHDASRWAQQLLVLRRAAERGVAPAVVHVDEAARAIVSRRVEGVPLPAVLADPGQRAAAIAAVVEQLRELHALDPSGIAEGDPLAHARGEHAAQRARPGFPAWAAALDPIFDEIEAILARDRRRVVSHNDLNPGNILWDGARAWLVDWEVAGLGHPFYDLAALAMFLQLGDAAVDGLLAQQERRPVDDAERATFAALRRLVALLCGLLFASLVPDLSLLPASPPTLAAFYAELRAGTLDLQDARGRGAFALALLHLGISGGAAPSAAGA